MVGENSDCVPIEVMEMAHKTASVSKLGDAISLFCMTQGSAGIGNWVYFVILLVLTKYSSNPLD